MVAFNGLCCYCYAYFKPRIFPFQGSVSPCTWLSILVRLVLLYINIEVGVCNYLWTELLMANEKKINDVIQFKIDLLVLFFTWFRLYLCCSMLPLFVKDDLVLAAVATTVLHALICRTCLTISSAKDDQQWDRVKSTLVNKWQL